MVDSSVTPCSNYVKPISKLEVHLPFSHWSPPPILRCTYTNWSSRSQISWRSETAATLIPERLHSADNGGRWEFLWLGRFSSRIRTTLQTPARVDLLMFSWRDRRYGDDTIHLVRNHHLYLSLTDGPSGQDRLFYEVIRNNRMRYVCWDVPATMP